MITYEYLCADCSNNEFIKQSIKDSAINQCPKCQSSLFQRVISGGSGFIIEKEIKTLGGQTARNERKNGKYWLEDKRKYAKDRRNKAKKHLGKLPEGASTVEVDRSYTPFWRKDSKVDTSLADLKGEELKKYVLTGTKPMKSESD